jgi:hypothetical protein
MGAARHGRSREYEVQLILWLVWVFIITGPHTYDSGNRAIDDI